jgi:glycine betaine/proline transport system substrate-binding protein
MPITRRSKGVRCVSDLWRAPRSALLVLAGCLILLPVARAAGALQEPESCRVVRLSDIGWTAESVATAVFAKLLTDLGYQPQVTVLSVPVTFESMRNGDIDIFLGNWLPAQETLLQPFLDDSSVDLVRKNLVGAKYTLGVPDYLYEAGLHDFADIRRFGRSSAPRSTALSPATTAICTSSA